ncbi:MAG: tyrosine-type recombinase/integrase [Proteobacteria bacterium]|nr:tyrosine-type recombinase/integrase [Pseudomonadota bacterium]
MSDMDITLDYLSEEKSRHGKTRYYARWKGKRVRLVERPGSPEFLEEYRTAMRKLRAAMPTIPAPEVEEKGEAPFAAKTLGWLIERYFTESPDYKVLNPIGKTRRRRILEDLKAAHGRRGMMMSTESISAGVAKRSTSHGAANDWLKSVKALYSWAFKVRITTANPADPLRKIKVATDGFHIWSLEEIAAFAKKHPLGSRAYLALMLMLFTGLRRSDAASFGRQHIRDGVVRFRPGKTGAKTGAELVTALAWPLKQAMDACPAPDGNSSMAFLLSGWDRPFSTGAAFGNWFGDRCDEAGIPHCTPHGLRKAAASIAAEGGASDLMLDAMFAWSESGSANQSRTYTRNASKLKLASEGFELVAASLVAIGVIKPEQIGSTIVAPEPGVSHGATKTASK